MCLYRIVGLPFLFEICLSFCCCVTLIFFFCCSGSPSTCSLWAPFFCCVIQLSFYSCSDNPFTFSFLVVVAIPSYSFWKPCFSYFRCTFFFFTISTLSCIKVHVYTKSFLFIYLNERWNLWLHYLVLEIND